MIGWLALGLVAGFLVGFAAAWMLLRSMRSARPAPAAPRPSMAPEPALSEPLPAADRTDEEIHEALDATKGLLDELEGRYRGRTAPPEEGRPKPARRRPKGPR